MLPIKFKDKVKSKIEDDKLVKKAKAINKPKVKSDSMLDIINDIRKDIDTNLGDIKQKFQYIMDEQQFIDYIDKANEYGKIAIDTETFGLDEMHDDIIGICLYFPKAKATYIPINHIDYITGQKIPNQLSREFVANQLKRLTAKIIMHNSTFDIRILKHTLGIKVKCFWDTVIAANLMNENESHKLKELHSKYISHKEEKSFGDYFKGGIFAKVPIDCAYIYGSNDAIDTFELYEFQHKFLNKDARQDLADLYNLMELIETPMIDVVVELEENGVAIDKEYVKHLYDKYHSKLDIAYNNCIKAIEVYNDKITDFRHKNPTEKLDNPISLNSPKQLGILFYNILGMKPVRGQKGDAVNETVLKARVEEFPDIINNLLEYRSIKKLTSTYIDNILELIDTDGRIHTHFNSLGAKTGRMSSSRPINLQNIPSHNLDIRKMFIGQITYKDYETTDIKKVTIDRCAEVELANNEWIFVEQLKNGDKLVDGEIIDSIKISDFTVDVFIK